MKENKIIKDGEEINLGELAARYGSYVTEREEEIIATQEIWFDGAWYCGQTHYNLDAIPEGEEYSEIWKASAIDEDGNEGFLRYFRPSVRGEETEFDGPSRDDWCEFLKY